MLPKIAGMRVRNRALLAGSGVSGPSISGVVLTNPTVPASASLSLSVSEVVTLGYVYITPGSPLSATAAKAAAIASGQTMVLSLGANSTTMVNYPSTSGTYQIQLVAWNAANALSNVVLTDSFTITAFAYTWVFNSASPHTTATASFKVSPTSFTARYMTLFFALNIQAWNGTNFILKCLTGHQIYIDPVTKKLRVIWGNYGNAATVFDYTSTETFSLTSDYSLYVAIDMVAQTVVAWRNGVALTMTGTTTPSGSMEFKTLDDWMFLSDSGLSAYTLNTKVAAVWMELNNTGVIAPSNFWSGGPKSLAGVGAPTLWRGEQMTADEELGDGAHGWNDAYNKGSAPISIYSATFANS